MEFLKRLLGDWAGGGPDGGSARGSASAPWPVPTDDRAFERRRFVQSIRAKVEKELRDHRLSPAPDRLWQVMEAIPREAFLPPDARAAAYRDEPLPIGAGQTTSQPSLQAVMTAALAPKPTERVLEIGCGGGYQTALLARLAGRVYGVEVVPDLAAKARAALAGQGIDNVEVLTADGTKGWRSHAPFDAILAGCAARRLPPDLFDQLKVGGRIIAPVGPKAGPQILVMVEKKAGGKLMETPLMNVMFVPMAGAS